MVLACFIQCNTNHAIKCILYFQLRLSEDFGLTWTLLKERVTERFFWGVPGVDHDPRTVHMELQDPIGPVSYHCCIGKNSVNQSDHVPNYGFKEAF